MKLKDEIIQIEQQTKEIENTRNEIIDLLTNMEV